MNSKRIKYAGNVGIDSFSVSQKSSFVPKDEILEFTLNLDKPVYNAKVRINHKDFYMVKEDDNYVLVFNKANMNVGTNSFRFVVEVEKANIKFPVELESEEFSLQVTEENIYQYSLDNLTILKAQVQEIIQKELFYEN